MNETTEEELRELDDEELFRLEDIMDEVMEATEYDVWQEVTDILGQNSDNEVIHELSECMESASEAATKVYTIAGERKEGHEDSD